MKKKPRKLKRRSGAVEAPWRLVCIGHAIDAFSTDEPALYEQGRDEEEAAAMAATIARMLDAARRCLSERELAMVTRYWLDGYKGVEIALEFECTQARVSQLVGRNGSLLRKVRDELRIELADPGCR